MAGHFSVPYRGDKTKYFNIYNFSFSFPEEMDGLIDFLFVHRSLFLSIRPSKNIKKSEIKVLFYTLIM